MVDEGGSELPSLLWMAALSNNIRTFQNVRKKKRANVEVTST